MSHTPGPWKARGTTSLGMGVVVAPHASFSEGHLICRVNRSFFDGDSHEMTLPREQVESNARLLAAAPDLLEACQAVLAALENADLQGTVLWIEPPYQAPAVHESAQERLQAVIAKATGKD